MDSNARFGSRRSSTRVVQKHDVPIQPNNDVPLSGQPPSATTYYPPYDESWPEDDLSLDDWDDEPAPLAPKFQSDSPYERKAKYINRPEKSGHQALEPSMRSTMASNRYYGNEGPIPFSESYSGPVGSRRVARKETGYLHSSVPPLTWNSRVPVDSSSNPPRPGPSSSSSRSALIINQNRGDVGAHTIPLIPPHTATRFPEVHTPVRQSDGDTSDRRTTPTPLQQKSSQATLSSFSRGFLESNTTRVSPYPRSPAPRVTTPTSAFVLAYQQSLLRRWSSDSDWPATSPQSASSVSEHGVVRDIAGRPPTLTPVTSNTAPSVRDDALSTPPTGSSTSQITGSSAGKRSYRTRRACVSTPLGPRNIPTINLESSGTRQPEHVVVLDHRKPARVDEDEAPTSSTAVPLVIMAPLGQVAFSSEDANIPPGSGIDPGIGDHRPFSPLRKALLRLGSKIPLIQEFTRPINLGKKKTRVLLEKSRDDGDAGHTNTNTISEGSDGTQIGAPGGNTGENGIESGSEKRDENGSTDPGPGNPGNNNDDSSRNRKGAKKGNRRGVGTWSCSFCCLTLILKF